MNDADTLHAFRTTITERIEKDMLRLKKHAKADQVSPEQQLEAVNIRAAVKAIRKVYGDRLANVTSHEDLNYLASVIHIFSQAHQLHPEGARMISGHIQTAY